MTTYKQNSATINVDICTVSAEACAVDLDCLLGSFKRIMSSGVVCGVLQRILEAGQVGAFDSACPVAFPAKEIWIGVVPFPQFEVVSSTCLRTVRNFFSNLTAQCAQTQRVFAKRYFAPILGLLKPCIGGE